MRFNILILDDEKVVCNSLKRVIQDDEKRVITATTVEKALQILNEEEIDLILLDYKLRDRDGIKVLSELREMFPDLAVVMITAHGSIETAVDAMKLGAIDFIQKKVDADFIRFTVQRVLDNLRLKKEVQMLRQAFRKRNHLPKIITESPAMKEVLTLAGEFAKSDSIVLIEGETGSGKNFVAEIIHNQSDRFNRPFVSMNCSAIPSDLLESELFGYAPGAFTGARNKGKKGLIEQADGGTLFLDEIGELNFDLQTKLLHILEQNAFLRLGAESQTKVDVRFIAATNARLQELVQEKRFRMDLYYRLNVATIHVPPLRERKQDILPLAKLFIEHFNRKFNKSISQISDEAKQYLQDNEWRGNVRELRNCIERAMLVKKGLTLQVDDFTTPFQKYENSHASDNAFALNLPVQSGVNLLHEAQRQVILKALELTDNNISKAAQLLGTPRTSLNSCIQRFNIDLKR